MVGLWLLWRKGFEVGKTSGWGWGYTSLCEAEHREQNIKRGKGRRCFLPFFRELVTILQNGNLGDRSLDTKLDVVAMVSGSSEVSTPDSAGISCGQMGVEAKD